MRLGNKRSFLGGICVMILITGCSNTAKVVIEADTNYESTWSYDQDYHFKKSLDKEDDSVIDYKEHYLDSERKDENGYLFSDCIICGYRRYATPIEGKFELQEIKDDVYPYVEEVKIYLVGQSTNPDEHLVSDYCNGILSADAPVTVRWSSEDMIDHFEVICSRNADFTENEIEPNKIYIADKNMRSVEIYNLYPGTKYYVKVTEVFMDAEKASESLVMSFETSNISTRVMHVEGIKNVRDLGGYSSSLVENTTTKQGMIYRGSALYDEKRQLAITNSGEETFLTEMGIKTEIELRDDGEYVSPLSDKITYRQLPIGVYHMVFDEKQIGTKESYQELMKILADEKSYPVYIHCQQGDDRTGTVAFFLNALLGVGYNDLCVDYEMTSFSPSGLRGARNEQNYSNHFTDIYQGLMSYGTASNPESITECAENFFKSLGVSEETLEEIRRINIEGYKKNP